MDDKIEIKIDYLVLDIEIKDISPCDDNFSVI